MLSDSPSSDTTTTTPDLCILSLISLSGYEMTERDRESILVAIMILSSFALGNTADTTVKKTPIDVTVFAGSTVLLPCEVRNNEIGVRSWIRQRDLHILAVGEQSFTNDARISPIKKNSKWTLEIRFAQPRDSGFYTCQVYNEQQSLKYEVKLNVIKPQLKLTVDVGGTTTVRAGSSITLQCQSGQKIEAGSIKWFHNGTLVIAESSQHYISATVDSSRSQVISKLTVGNSTVDNAGTYTCQTTGGGKASLDIKITEENPPMLHVKGVTFTSVSLAWIHEIQAPEQGLQYIVKYKPDDSDEDFEVITNISANSLDIEGLQPMIEYAFNVQSSRPNGVIGPPSEKIFVTPATISFSLLRAVENGHLSVVSDLLQLDPDINEGDGMYLKMASQMGHLEVVNFLLAEGADPDADDDGEAVQEASKSGHLEIVKVLLEAGADANVGDGMHYAVEHDNPDIIKLLHQYGADVNKPLPESPWKDPETGTYYGFNWTALHVAARWGKPTLVKLLYGLGSDIKAKDPQGDTPLHVAVKYPQIWFVRELLKYCPDLTLQNNDGKTVIDLVEDLPHEIYSSLSSEEGIKLRHLVANITLDKIKTCSNTEEAAAALEDEVEALVESNSTIKRLVDSVESTGSHVDYVLQELFEDTIYIEIEDAFADHLCTSEGKGEWKANLGVRYIADCKCIPGKGPSLLLRPLDASGGCDDISPRMKTEG